MYQELALRGPVQLTLKARDGRTWIFDERVSRLRELRKLVEEHTLNYLLPPTREAYEATGTATFGVVSVNREGVVVGRQTLPWDLIGDMRAERGQLTFVGREPGDRLGYVDLAQVPNVHVLLALAEHARARSS